MRPAMKARNKVTLPLSSARQERKLSKQPAARPPLAAFTAAGLSLEPSQKGQELRWGQRQEQTLKDRGCRSRLHHLGRSLPRRKRADGGTSARAPGSAKHSVTGRAASMTVTARKHVALKTEGFNTQLSLIH